MRLSEALMAVVAAILLAACLAGCESPVHRGGYSTQPSDTVPANCAFRAGLNECDKEYDA